MKLTKGVLIIPASYNGSAIKNILSVVFNEQIITEHKLPSVDRITFLQTNDLEKIKLGDKEYSPLVAYEKILKDLNLDSKEIRRKKSKNIIKIFLLL